MSRVLLAARESGGSFTFSGNFFVLTFRFHEFSIYWIFIDSLVMTRIHILKKRQNLMTLLILVIMRLVTIHFIVDVALVMLIPAITENMFFVLC